MKQKEDLNKAEDTLLEIINDMDNIMKDKFVSTFNEIRMEFKKVFRDEMTIEDSVDLARKEIQEVFTKKDVAIEKDKIIQFAIEPVDFYNTQPNDPTYIQLAKDMEAKFDQMNEIVQRYCK